MDTKTCSGKERDRRAILRFFCEVTIYEKIYSSLTNEQIRTLHMNKTFPLIMK